MMMRRKGSERKAATQALQVIAESIRASKGRGGRPSASAANSGKSTPKPSLQRSRSEVIEMTLPTKNAASKSSSYISREQRLIARESKQLSLMPSLNQTQSNYLKLRLSTGQRKLSQQGDKENVKPSSFQQRPQELNPENNLEATKIQSHPNKLKQEIEQANSQMHAKASNLQKNVMCPPSPVLEVDGRRRRRGNLKTIGQETLRADIPQDSLDCLLLKKSMSLELPSQTQLKLLSQNSLESCEPLYQFHIQSQPQMNPDFQITEPQHEDLKNPQHDRLLQYEHQAQKISTFLSAAKKVSHMNDVTQTSSPQLEEGDTRFNMNKDIQQSFLSKKEDLTSQKGAVDQLGTNEQVIIKQSKLLMHQTPATQALLDSKDSNRTQLLDKEDEGKAAQDHQSNKEAAGSAVSRTQSDATSSIDDDEGNNMTQTTGMHGGAGGGATSGTTNGLGGSGSQGRWTDEEHDKFLEGLRLFGKDWRRIEEYIATRSCAQIRSHAQKYFNRLQRDIARGIKRSDEAQASILLGKKKRKLSSGAVSGDRKFQTAEQASLQPSIKQLKTSQAAAIEKGCNQPRQVSSPQKSEQIFNVIPQAKVALITQEPTPQISLQTNQQIQQIHETLAKLSEDDLDVQLSQLIRQREQISFDLLSQKLSREAAGEILVEITHRFHYLAMQALQSCKFDLCNRLIDERNLTQFVCILLSRQITIEPPQSQFNKEIVQKVDISPKQSAAPQQLIIPQYLPHFQLQHQQSAQVPEANKQFVENLPFCLKQ